MNNIKDLLPIGSIVRLEGATKSLMIFGIKQTDKSTGREYDYISVFYPEGNVGEGGQFFFDHVNIDQVLFTGFTDDERTAFIDKLSAFYDAKEKA